MSLAPRLREQPRSDEATGAAAHGTAAFGELYTAHFDGLYDFVARIVRDRDLSGEIVQATFTKAWDELRAGRELRQPKAWLYAVARNHALDELRRHHRLADEPLIYAQPDPSRLADPQAVAEDNEIVELVWTSAAALTPDEYSLLDLHVRHGFGAADLADALDLERGAVYTRLSRMRSSLEESVASTLLVRRGSADCPELAAIIAEHDGGDSITPQLRRAVRTHVKECKVCTEARRRVVSPVALFGALVPVVPLAGMREGILGAILPAGSGHAAGAAAAGGAGAVAAVRQSGKAKYLVGAGSIAAAAAIVAIALSSGSNVQDPSSASSPDHAVGIASADRTVSMRWSPGKNATGYSVTFSRDKAIEPPARENVQGTQYTSPPLGPGRWWFILRSHGSDGSWTDTLRVGPFVITAAVARATARTKAKAVTHGTHRRAHTKRAARVRAASKPTTTAAPIVADVRSAPRSAPRAPTTAPRHTPVGQTPVKKKPRTKKPPPSAVSPPAVKTPPATVAPVTPVAPTQPTQTPAPQTPPVVTTPPPAPPPGGGDDDEHDGDHGHGQGGGDGHGHGHGD